MKHAPLLPLLREIDLRLGIELALALRAIGRPRRQERSRKGWRTRRADTTTAFPDQRSV